MRKSLLLVVTTLLLATTSCASKTSKKESLSTNTPETPMSIANPSNPDAIPATIVPISTELNGHDAFDSLKKKYRGKVVLIDFWATWCPPCRAEMKEVDLIKTELQRKVLSLFTSQEKPLPKQSGRMLFRLSVVITIV